MPVGTFLLLGACGHLSAAGCLQAPFPATLGAPVHPFPGLVPVGTIYALGSHGSPSR